MAAILDLSGTPGCPNCKPGTFQQGLLDDTPCCTPSGTPPDIALYNNLFPFFDTTGDLNFYLAGVGTRDTDTNTNVVNIIVPDFTGFSPAGVAVVDAYLYWNILAADAVTADTVIFDGNGPFTGLLVGWCNDTCWLAQNDGSNSDGATPPQCIFNRVYRYNVSAFVPITGGTFRVELPGISTLFPSIATNGSDTPAYPGCNGSQGFALLVTYTDGVTRRIIAYDGAALVTNPGHGFGGYGTYSVTIDPGNFNKNAVIANAAGDTQTEYSDSLKWNGSPFPGNGFGSYFNPNAGNLLFTGAGAGADQKEPVTAVSGYPTIKNCPNTATIDITAGVECLDWFLFVYAAEDDVCCVQDTNPVAPYDQMSLYQNIVANADFVLEGVGTRNIDMAGVGTTININVPGTTVIKAWVYWNVFADNTNLATFNKINFKGAGDVVGTFIGWGDNTCWSVCDPGDGSNTVCDTVGGYNEINKIKNRVYRLDVTAQVTTGMNPYTVKLPGAILDPGICTACPDGTTHYPGCAGTQGVALFVIYDDPIERNILLYDGCAVVIPDDFPPFTLQTPGPIVPSYSIGFDTIYYLNAKIALAVGDSQNNPAVDKLIFNHVDLQTIPNHFTPDSGALLSANTIDPVKAFPGPCCGKFGNTVTVSTTSDCLSWFLFAYSAEKCTPNLATNCSIATVQNNNQHFRS
jgi:hypothetical protein